MKWLRVSQREDEVYGSDAAAVSALRGAERAVSWRVLPVLLLLVMTSFIDRTNLSFASVTMNEDLGLGPATYGLGAGLFSLGYAVAMVPANVALLRLGAPLWLAALCLAWGVTAGAFAFVRTAAGFLALRLLLGLCESGSIPGAWAVVAQLYPPDRTTLPLVVIETGITASQILGAPLAAGLLALDGSAGLKGWQWVFLGEALPAVLLSGFVFLLLPKSIAAADFLTPAQKAALEAAVSASPAPAASAAGVPEKQRRSGIGGGSNSSFSSSKAPGAGPGSSGDDGSGSDGDSLPGHTSFGGSQQPAAAVAERALRGRASAAARSDPAMPALHSAAKAGAGRAPSPGLAGPGPRAADGEVTLPAVLAALRRPIVVYAGAWRIMHDVASSGLLFFTPLIIQAMAGAPEAAVGSGGHTPDGGLPPERVALLSTVPYLVTTIVHLVNGWHSQRTNERRLHLALCWAAGAVALVALPAAMGPGGSPGAAFALLVLAHVGLNGANGVGTSYVQSFLEGPDKVISLAAYNVLGQIGSFAGPYLIGVLRQSRGSYGAALGLVGASLGVAAALVLLLSEPWARRGVWRWGPGRQLGDGDEEAGRLVAKGRAGSPLARRQSA